MTRDDADQVAKRIVNIWRTGIPHAEWSNYLVGLDDPAIAHAAIDRHLEREPRSFREFGQMYRAVAATQPAPDDEPADVVPLRPRLTREQVTAILRANGAGHCLDQPRRKAT